MRCCRRVYANTGQSALAPEFARKAFELRDRVSERERFFISWRYYRDATQDWDKALELARVVDGDLSARSVRVQQPRAVARCASASSSRRSRRFAKRSGSIRSSSRRTRTSPASLLALNRYDEAAAVLQEAAAAKLDFVGRPAPVLSARVRPGDDADAMARELAASVGVGETNAAFGWQAHALADAAARSPPRTSSSGAASRSALQGGFSEVAAQLTMEDAENHAIVGAVRRGAQEVTAGLQLSRDNVTLERASRALALCGDEAEAALIVRELGEAVSRTPR